MFFGQLTTNGTELQMLLNRVDALIVQADYQIRVRQFDIARETIGRAIDIVWNYADPRGLKGDKLPVELRARIDKLQELSVRAGVPELPGWVEPAEKIAKILGEPIEAASKAITAVGKSVEESPKLSFLLILLVGGLVIYALLK